MTRPIRARAPVRAALLLLLAATSTPAFADAAADAAPDEILITAENARRAIDRVAPASASLDAERIATTVNAVNVEDAIKYLPGLIVRKRHIGDTQAPLATRTSGLGASARSLIYADGALLSALIGNNNTSASPRWGLVTPQEIARIDVLYGPYSAAYPGNSIGAVVNITTRLPETLEASLDLGTNLQQFDQYGTHATLPAFHAGATIGDRFGRLALFASASRVTSNGQPLTYVTALRSGTPSSAGTPASGGFDDVNRLGAPTKVLGAGGIEHQRQDVFKLKAALDVTPDVRLAYVVGLFRNDTDARAETYLADAAGRPVYAGAINLGGSAVTLAPGAFSGGVYRLDQRHWLHALSATGAASRLDWQVVGTLFDFAHDVQRIPTTALPAATAGGAGTITRLDGTGWQTADVRVTWRSDDAATHSLSIGGHFDRFHLDSNRYATTDWIGGSAGALNLASRGTTRTLAVWAQDAWTPVAAVTLTLGGRYEWWRAYDGVNISTAPPLATVQPERSAARFSPKAAVAWVVAPAWTLRAAFGEANRFPTVAELYQIVTTPVPAVPNPDLRPERARSEEVAVEHRDTGGTVRLSLFNEEVRDALISQLGPLNGTTTVANFVQNVDRTRARGVELAFERTNVVARVDLSGSVTYADATTRSDLALPAAVGKLIPGVPRWKATLVGTYRPTDAISLTAAGRVTSRFYGTIDNSDIVGNTYQGFDRYLVVDLRARFRVTRQIAFGVGVDNVTNDRYFLFHPFPQRSFAADLSVTL